MSPCTIWRNTPKDILIKLSTNISRDTNQFLLGLLSFVVVHIVVPCEQPRESAK